MESILQSNRYSTCQCRMRDPEAHPLFRAVRGGVIVLRAVRLGPAVVLLLPRRLLRSSSARLIVLRDAFVN